MIFHQFTKRIQILRNPKMFRRFSKKDFEEDVKKSHFSKLNASDWMKEKFESPQFSNLPRVQEFLGHQVFLTFLIKKLFLSKFKSFIILKFVLLFHKISSYKICKNSLSVL